MYTSVNDCQDLAATGRNSMSRSLDNDCTIQDLAFQVLNPFGAKNFNIRPLPRIMPFMTWPSKTWTQVNMIVKTWQPPQFWNLTFFLRLGNIPCLEMLHFLATPCPQVLTMIALDIQDLAVQVLKLFGAKNFNIWPLPRIMSFMTWSSKTWPQVNMIVKTWQPQVWNLTFLFGTILQLHVLKSWQRLHYSRLGFPSLETFCCIDFQQYNQDLCLSWLGLPRHEHKWKWLSRLGSHRSEILHSSFKTWHAKFWNVTCLQLSVPRSWQITALFKTWLSKSWNFLQETVWECLACACWCL